MDIKAIFKNKKVMIGTAIGFVVVLIVLYMSKSSTKSSDTENFTTDENYGSGGMSGNTSYSLEDLMETISQNFENQNEIIDQNNQSMIDYMGQYTQSQNAVPEDDLVIDSEQKIIVPEIKEVKEVKRVNPTWDKASQAIADNNKKSGAKSYNANTVNFDVNKNSLLKYTEKALLNSITKTTTTTIAPPTKIAGTPKVLSTTKTVTTPVKIAATPKVSTTQTTTIKRVNPTWDKASQAIADNNKKSGAKSYI